MAAAAIAAVSARRINGPSETGCAPKARNWFSSPGLKSPSGPMAMASRRSAVDLERDFSAWPRGGTPGSRDATQSWVVSVGAECANASAKDIGPRSSGSQALRDCLAASMSVWVHIVRFRSTSAAGTRATHRSVSSKTNCSTPNSTDFSRRVSKALPFSRDCNSTTPGRGLGWI